MATEPDAEEMLPYQRVGKHWLDFVEATASMHKTVRAAVFLIGRFPILCAPVLLADLASFAVNHAEKSVSAAIAKVVRHHSVLNGLSVSTTMDNSIWSTYAKVAILTIPQAWLARYLAVAFYVVAFRVIVNFLFYRVPEQVNSSLRIAPTTIRSIAVFSLKVLMLIGLSVMLTVIPISVYLFKIQDFSGSNDWAFIEGISIMVLGAILAGPMAVKWLRGSRGVRLSGAIWREASCLAVIAVLISSLAGYAVHRMELMIYVHTHTKFIFQILQLIGSMLAAIPYVPLFIALTLLACPICLDAREQRSDLQQDYSN